MTTDPLLCLPPPRATLLVAALATLACYQPSPPLSDDDGIVIDSSGESGIADEDESAGTDDNTTGADTDNLEDSLYPLIDGAQWTYVVKSTFGQILDTQILEAHETVWKGMKAWELVDEPDLAGEWDASTIIRQGDLVLRVHRKELNNFGPTEIIDYEPGFLRANQAWVTVGFQEEREYTRTAYDGAGENPDVEARAHTYEVLALDEEITVPAGTFHCVKVERTRTLGAEAGAIALFWFAPGIGKVREERPIEMEIEELVSVSIPGGANLP